MILEKQKKIVYLTKFSTFDKFEIANNTIMNIINIKTNIHNIKL